MKYERKKRIEVEIYGWVDSRKEMEARGFIGNGENKMPYRAVVEHPDGRREWQWCERLMMAKRWVDHAINRYQPTQLK